MHHNYQKVQAGFTLLEMLVSVAIISLVSAVLSQTFISTIRNNTKTEILKEVKQNGDLAIETITRMVQSAQSVTCTNSQTLTIVNTDGGTSTIGCVLDGTTLRLASSSASTTVYITSKSVTLGVSACSSSSLSFTCQEAPSSPTAVTLSFDLSRAGGSVDQFEDATESFQTSTVMRSNQ